MTEHVHHWAHVGALLGTHFAFPCLEPACDAYCTCPPVGPVGYGWPTNIGGIPLDIEDDPVTAVYKQLYWEAATYYRLPELPLPQNATILEVGAHVGVMSIYLAKRLPDALIYAVEPEPANFARLTRNVNANSASGQVITINAAIAAQSGPGRLCFNQDNSGGHALGGAGVAVECIGLSDFLQESGTTHIDLLIIDCEGSEWDILTAPDAPLDQIRCIVGEIHRGPGHGEPRELVAYLHERMPDVPMYWQLQ